MRAPFVSKKYRNRNTDSIRSTGSGSGSIRKSDGDSERKKMDLGETVGLMTGAIPLKTQSEVST